MKKLIFLLIILPWIGKGYAQEATFTASAPDAVVVGDQFRLSYTITSHDVKYFKVSLAMDGFDVLMGPTRSQQSFSQNINGVQTSIKSVVYTYILMAKKEGTFSLPAATIVANGETTISNAVNIKVLPQDEAAKAANNSSGQSSSRPSSSSSTGNTVSNEDLFITCSASKTKVYEQEAFLLTYKIFTLVDLRSFDSVKLPDFKGFHSQEVELGTQKWQMEHYNGRNYHTTIYRQFVLFPQHAGELVIEPARFDASIARVLKTVDPFDSFFNGGRNIVEIKKTIYTPKVTINANALPSGKPVGFSGAVGDFSITSSINTRELKTNDAITVKIVISGTGNMKLFSNPEIKFPDDFEVYDPKVDNIVRLTSSGLTGNRVIEYLAIPRHSGSYKIPAVSFSYFDVKSQSYKTLSTEDYIINVERGQGNAEQVVSSFSTNKEELRVLGEDIRFIRLNHDKLYPKGKFFYNSLLYWLFYIIPAIAFIIFFIVYRNQIIENSNTAKLKIKKANKVAIKRLKLAGKLLSQNKKDDFYDEVLKALWGYISDKLNIPVSKLSKDNIEEKLIKHGVNDELVNEFIEALNECEFARFAPGDEHQAMDKVYSSALTVISKIENSIKH